MVVFELTIAAVFVPLSGAPASAALRIAINAIGVTSGVKAAASADFLSALIFFLFLVTHCLPLRSMEAGKRATRGVGAVKAGPFRIVAALSQCVAVGAELSLEGGRGRLASGFCGGRAARASSSGEEDEGCCR